MQTNSDFRGLFAELNAAGAEYLVVGAHALGAHAFAFSPRRHLIENKKTSGRLQDLADVEFLEKG